MNKLTTSKRKKNTKKKRKKKASKKNVHEGDPVIRGIQKRSRKEEITFTISVLRPRLGKVSSFQICPWQKEEEEEGVTANLNSRSHRA